MEKKALLASALTVLAMTALPAAQAGAMSPGLSPAPVPTDTGASPPAPTDMTSPSPTDMTSPSPTDMTSPSPTGTGAMTEPFGPACASLPATGEGSLEDMAGKPVADAVASNPELSTLNDAIKQAGVAETLNSAEDVTVFAPTNDAFDKVPKDTLDKLLADKEELTKVLTYHVVEGKKTPENLTEGTLTTLQGGTLTVEGSGEEFTIDDAKIVCGNIQTANATVYLIDGVLMPK
ncbi:putative surface protein with fasciclin (FAS1) repeats [Streptosporangium becharense]|uniref:Putative surface protein with fasciclin (FAS1) repeats n=1 Tax=Streptosporangium becharense TaxID=1816182 RepID=A0A7W9INQ6_9ACTN|nr:fasciclin domain-containing protein [Streptosporangium becharense]MBB2914475.1 putative surface protein with fasciclin (FAS1) repeats [Streptosporangium becharense]MBB5823493.1 putative surface protein with fasciclin (FAS1) repeats [Streptosporangium becharense]